MKYAYALTIIEVDNSMRDEWSSLVRYGAPYYSFEVPSKEEAYEWLRENGFVPKSSEPFISWERLITNRGKNDRTIYRTTHLATVTRVLEGLPKKKLSDMRFVHLETAGHAE
ncbi:MAG: hypothetical protein SPF22_08420 [Candidatus Onthovivens sp.]|nr:hypothetical protein [Candidatus Onthovivens sp.]